MIKLSILIPVYNAEKYIAGLLDCILPQMNDSMELILLNDGSSDSSGNICAKYEANYPAQVKLISRENKGAVCTRRELFQASSGEWIWIIDSDDMLFNNSITRIMDEIYSDDSYDMILFDHCLYSDNNKKIVHQLSCEDGEIFEGKQKEILYKSLINETRLNPLWNKVFKRNCIDFDVDYSEYEDVRKANDCLQTIPIITNAEKIKYRQMPLYIYNTTNEGSLSHKFREYTYTSLKKVWLRRKKYINKWGMWNELRESYYLHGASVASDLLSKYAQSQTSEQEYDSFFERMMTDGVFSEMIENCDCSKLTGKSKFFLNLIKNRKIKLSYTLFSAWGKINQIRRR